MPSPSLPKAFCDAINGVKIGPMVGSCGTAAYLGVPVIVPDIAVDERWAAYKAAALPHGLRACWSMPIVGNQGAMLGTFAVYHDHPHSPTPREAYLVDRFTHLTAVAIDHSRLFGALAESEERFRRAFEDNAVGMAMMSLDGRFLRVNRALCEMVGRNEEELLAADFRAITHPDDVVASHRALRRVTRGVGDSTQLEQRCLHRDGTSVTVTVTVSALRDAEGAPIGVSANVVDLTERRAAEEERQARHEAEVARTAAEAASRAKSEFLSALSHEVRTPLSAVVGFAELLETLELAPERRQSALRQIAEAANHITGLLDDVLDIAKIEAGAVRLDLEPIPIGSIVADVVALVEPLATDRGIIITTAPSEGRPAGDGRLSPRPASAPERRHQRHQVQPVGRSCRAGVQPEGTVRDRPGYRHRTGHPAAPADGGCSFPSTGSARKDRGHRVPGSASHSPAGWWRRWAARSPSAAARATARRCS